MSPRARASTGEPIGRSRVGRGQRPSDLLRDSRREKPSDG
jgi:hypothetical protein